ncbi:MAG: efflux RND transporter permease subunit [Bacteroides sp.]|nr:efflux RND transporter permease subunit [Bacteroides sp.]
MLNRLIKFSLYNRFIVVILSALIFIAGVVVLLRSEIDIFPDLNAPTVTVMTEAPGLAPEEVEQLVTFPIETAVNGATGVRRVRSSSATGFSVVNVEFDWGTDIYVARQTVSERIAGVAENFQSGVENPVLGPQSSILGEVLIIGLTADSTSMMQLRSIADRVIRPRLLSIRGVAQVAVIGGDVKEMQVKLNSAAMKRYGVTLDETLAACESMTRNAAGGIVNDFGNEYTVKGLLASADAETLGRNVVKSDDNGVVTLADVATISLGAESPRIGLASERGKPAVLITVTKQPAVGTIKLNDALIATLDKLKPTLPSDINISTDIFSQSTFIENSIGNLQQSLIEGSLFVIIVLFFFLMNLRTTLVSIVALPMSVVVTVLVLNLFGININTMTMGGIAIAIGSLVDDAIVDVENVYKRLRQNRQLPVESRRASIDVVYEASKEVRMPVLNSSLIIIASFLPLFFLSGIEGRMLIPLGIAFIVSLVVSTLIALTLTPALCSYLLGGDTASVNLDKEPWLTRKIKGVYNSSLSRALGYPKAILGVTAMLVVVAVIMFVSLGRSFLPGFNEGSFTINVSTLPGVSIDESDRIGRIAEGLILSVPEIQTVARKTGRAELDEHALGSNVSEIEAPYILSGRSRSEVSKELRSKLSKLPGCNIEVGQPISHRIDAMLSGTEAQIAIKLFGDDLTVLHNKGTEIMSAIKGVDGVVDANIEQQIGRPQLDIKPRREMLVRYGISLADFSRFISTVFSGVQVSKIYENGFPYNLTVKLDNTEYDSIDKINDILIDSNEGKIPLSYVADIVSTTGPNTINREDVNRRVVISANVEERDLRGVVNDIQKVIADKVKLPQGYFIKIGGQFESEAAASRTLMLMSGLSILIIFMLLYYEFKNVQQSLVILVNMPLAIIGGVFILVITGEDLNIPAIIGFISLMGISTRNGMLLINRYNHLKQDSVPLRQRVMQGSIDRLTPIMMTALTSTLALIPLALRGGEAGNEIQAPMATVILGGLITSTLLNIYVVPIIYTILNKKK